MTTTQKTSAKKKAPLKISESGVQIGTVESARNNKTRRVVVSFQSKHPKYGKYVRHSTVLQVHDENNVSGLGDRVEVAPCRPVSRTKKWAIVRVVAAAPREG